MAPSRMEPEEPPEFDEQTASDGDDADGSHATAAVGEATLEPTGT